MGVADAGTTGVKVHRRRFADDLRELKGTDIASESGPHPEFGLDKAGDQGRRRGRERTARHDPRQHRRRGWRQRDLRGGRRQSDVQFLQDFVFQRVDKKRGDFPDAADADASRRCDPAAARGRRVPDDGGDADPDEGSGRRVRWRARRQAVRSVWSVFSSASSRSISASVADRDAQRVRRSVNQRTRTRLLQRLPTGSCDSTVAARTKFVCDGGTDVAELRELAHQPRARATCASITPGRRAPRRHPPAPAGSRCTSP